MAYELVWLAGLLVCGCCKTKHLRLLHNEAFAVAAQRSFCGCCKTKHASSFDDTGTA